MAAAAGFTICCARDAMASPNQEIKRSAKAVGRRTDGAIVAGKVRAANLALPTATRPLFAIVEKNQFCLYPESVSARIGCRTSHAGMAKPHSLARLFRAVAVFNNSPSVTRTAPASRINVHRFSLP